LVAAIAACRALTDFMDFSQSFDMVIAGGGNAALCSAGLHLSMPYRKFVHGLYHVLALVKYARERRNAVFVD
jgi:hypothetical protein